MKIYGLMVAQNEGDILAETLEFLRRLKLFEQIFFFDLGSDDDTLATAARYSDLLGEPKQLNEVYSSALRFDLMARHRERFSAGDWLAIVDADEMYAEDPRRVIEIAEREGATCISTHQAEFMLTDVDVEALDCEDVTRPISERRRYYLIQWSEERFYRVGPGPTLFNNLRPCSRKLLNRHYQYRTPRQIGTRIRTRLANRAKARRQANRSTWPQIYSRNWRDYVVRHRLLHYDNGAGLRHGLPEGVQWKDYYSNNPFSTIFPQVATALATESGRTDATPDARGTGGPTTVDRAAARNSLLRDDYRDAVVGELRLNLRARRWVEATHALVVLLRHVPRWCFRIGWPAFRCGARRAKEALEDRMIGLKRRLGGRSHGVIRADPNPIVTPYLSWHGVTTLRWKASAAEVEVRVGAPDGRLFSRSGPAGKVMTGPWVEDSTIFYLQDVTDRRPLAPEHTLSRVTVGLVRGWYVSA